MDYIEVLTIIYSGGCLNDICAERWANLWIVNKIFRGGFDELTLLAAKYCSPVNEVTSVSPKSIALSDRDLNGKKGYS